MPRRRRLSLFVQLAVTALLLGLLFQDLNWNELRSIARHTPIWFYAAGFIMLGGGQLLYALRWKLVTRMLHFHAPFKSMVKIHLIGLFFNNFLPTAVGGDFARVFYLGRETGYGTATTSVLLDRLFGFFWTATWAVALCWLLPVSGANMVAGRHAIVIAALVLAACTGAVFFFPLGKLEDFIRRVSQDRLAGAAEGLANRLRLLRSRPKAFVGLGGIVLTYYFILAALYQEYFAMFRRSSPELVSILAVLFSIGLLANIPVSLNGIGLREQLHVILFGMLGIKKEIALGISLMMLLGLLLWSLVGCALWLQRRARPNNMRDASTRSRSMPPPRRPRPDERAE